MVLRDKDGRVVLLSDDAGGFFAVDGVSLAKVPEAIITKGEGPEFLPEAYIRKALDEVGFSWVNPVIDLKDKWRPLRIRLTSGSGGFGSRQIFHQIEERRVPEDQYKGMAQLLSNLNSYFDLWRSSLALEGGAHMSLKNIMVMIGAGKVVTPESLRRGCADGETRPRIILGDSVRITAKGGPFMGTVKSIGSSVSVLRQDGVKKSYPFTSVERIEGAVFDKGLADGVDPSIADALKATMQKGRIYSAKAERRAISMPAFPKQNERVVSLESTITCVCPVCGWRMADPHGDGDFECCYCRTRGILISKSETRISLLMMRIPAKNRFAVKEARCCANCGLFEFEVGREGKRTTGYCKASNQCLQAFNFCDLWFPRHPDRYAKGIMQHVKNLHFGVDDRRNTERMDIRDTIYTEDDHKAEVAKADNAKIAYENAYARFLDELRRAADKMPVTEEVNEETMRHWKKVLDDPC